MVSQSKDPLNNSQKVKEVSDYGIGMATIPDNARSIYIVTAESDNWKCGFEFDQEKAAFGKSLAFQKKGKLGYVFKIYLDSEKLPLAVFAYVDRTNKFKRII